jgi:hypothetical protein
MLRHTYCTNLLLHGADITFIQKLAGHTDIQTTAKYYLSVDREALRHVVKNCLNYDSEPPASASGVEMPMLTEDSYAHKLKTDH